MTTATTLHPAPTYAVLDARTHSTIRFDDLPAAQAFAVEQIEVSRQVNFPKDVQGYAVFGSYDDSDALGLVSFVRRNGR